MASKGYAYAVFVDDNFSLPPDDGRYKLGDFASLDEAIAACKRVVEEFLTDELSPESTRKERHVQYLHFGPDPFIVTDDPSAAHPPFSAREYAAKLCEDA